MNPSARDRSDASASETERQINRLVDEHGGQLYALAQRFCGDPHQAEDLVQEVFMNAARSWESFRGDASEKTWLYTIAARACQRMHRKKSGEPERIGSLHELLPFGEPLIAVIASEQNDAIQQQILAEARERLEAEITKLPDEFRIPLILKEIVGLSIRDIAQILGLQEATARSRVHRARLKLRAAVDSAIPRTPQPAPAPAYPEQTCLDLLNAKQESLDRGVPFDSSVICDRCRSVFSSLDLTQQVCQQLANDELPPGLRDRLHRQMLRCTQP